MNIKTDLHTHTIFSRHAYSTIEENCRGAAENKIEAIGITDHFSGMFFPNTDLGWYSQWINYKVLPKIWHDVRVLRGAEADIVDLDGNLFGHDIFLENPFDKNKKVSYEDILLMPLDYIIASIHGKEFCEDANIIETTEMYIKALNHPKVLFLGHPGRAGVPFEIAEVLKEAKRLDKYIEINESSLERDIKTKGACRRIAEKCAELSVGIVVNSDSHCSYTIGKYDNSKSMLEEIRFPEELIMNRELSIIEERIDGLKTDVKGF